MTADDAPEKARQAAANVLENTEASPIDKTIAQAVSLQQQGKSDEAIEKWRAVAHIAEGSDDDLAAKAWFSVGYLFRDKSPKDSISAYDEAIRLGPDYPLAYIGRGAEKAMLGQHEAAITDFDEAIRLRPDNPLAYTHRGRAKDKLGQHEAAIANHNYAIRLRTGLCHLAYVNRGLAKDALGLKDEARKDLKTALELARKAGNADMVAAVEQLLRRPRRRRAFMSPSRVGHRIRRRGRRPKRSGQPCARPVGSKIRVVHPPNCLLPLRERIFARACRVRPHSASWPLDALRSRVGLDEA